MHFCTKSTRPILPLATLLIIITVLAGPVSSAGISVDAGLTPAENRWIFRSQIRFMQRDNISGAALPEMTSYMFPLVVAYGLRSDLTVMVRQAIRQNEMTMGERSSSHTGLTDLLMSGKFRLARINKPNYTLGIAPVLGLEVPSGEENFTSNSWDLHLGWFISGRLRSLGIDLNATYVWNGMAKAGDADREVGDEITAEGAMAYQLGLGSNSDLALAPVVEISFKKMSSDKENGDVLTNTGESILLLSPGVKFTWSSFIFEGLLQFSAWQSQNGLQTERGPAFIIGMRLMS